MNDITYNYVMCDDIIAAFGKEKIERRYNTLFDELNAFIKDYNSVASVNKLLLGNALIDYFNDIKRLKDFHGIKLVNSQKKIAYTAYWLLKRKPIQINNPQIHDPEFISELSTLNEQFVLKYITDYLSTKKDIPHVLMRSETGLKNFSKTLLYYLRYRLHDAQSLELMIVAFFAGQIYEHTNGDISATLHPYDHEQT